MPKREAGVTALVIFLAVGYALGAGAQVLSSGPPSAPGLLPSGPGRVLYPMSMIQIGAAPVTDDDTDAPAIPSALLFDEGSDRLTVSATRMLDRLGLALSRGELARRRVRIVGHAEAGGTPEARQDMALRRARAVALYLQQNYNIAPARLLCRGVSTPAGVGRLVLVATAGG